MQWTYNITLRHTPATIVAVEKQQVLHMMRMCVGNLRNPVRDAHAP